MTRRWLLDASRAVLGALWVGGFAIYVFAAVRRGSVAAELIEGTGVQALTIGFGVIGLILTVRRRDHLIGWLLLGFAAAFATRLGVEEWVVWRGAAHPGFESPLGVLAINIAIVVVTVPLLMLMAAFPHDRLPRGGARKWMTAAVGVTLLGLPAAPIAGYQAYGVVLPPPIPGHEGLANILAFFSMLPLFAAFAALPIRLGRLLRRGDAVERLQIRWLVFVLTGVIVLLAITPLVPGANRVAALVAGVGVPVAIWVAITRHGLYEIDRIISRTLAYAIIAAVLAAVFAIGAVGLPQLIPAGSSKFAVAGTTLAAAALFSPLRKRALEFVDRRFHRLAYVADDVVDGLTRRLRGAVQQSTVVTEFTGAIRTTLSPSSLSIWIAGSRNDSGTAHV